MKVYGNINMQGNAEIIEIVVDSGTSDPSSPVAGELYYRSDLADLRFYTGSIWVSTKGITSITAGSSINVSTTGGVATVNVAVGGGGSAYNPTFEAGYVQYAGATDGFTLAGNTAFAFGLLIPNASGSALPGIVLGNYSTGGAVIIPDAVPEGSTFNSTPGSPLYVEAGDTNSTGTAVGGNLNLYAGSSFSGHGGNSILHGGNSTSTTATGSQGGDAIILGGSGYNAGGAYFEGGTATGTNGNGGNVVLAPSAANGSGAPGSTVIKSTTGAILYQFYKNGEIYIGGSSAGSAGQVLTSGGSGASTSWTSAGTGTVTSVAATGSAGLTVGGSPITTSGTLTFTLNSELQALSALSTTGFVQRTGTAAYSVSTLTSSQVTTALGYTPYNSTNPNGYTTNTGTVTSVSVTTANGVSGSVATATTTPAITLTLGAITPTSVVASGPISATGSISTNIATIDTTTTGPVSMTASTPTTIDTISTSAFRVVKYIVAISQGTTAYHGCEIFIVQDGTTVYKTEYADVYTGSSLGTFNASISGGNMVLQFTPAATSTYTAKVIKTQITV